MLVRLLHEAAVWRDVATAASGFTRMVWCAAMRKWPLAVLPYMTDECVTQAIADG